MSLSPISFPVIGAVDNAGNIYFYDNDTALRKVTYSTGLLSTLAGTSGTYGGSGDGAAAKAALLDFPVVLAIDGGGNFYIVDTANNAIRKINTKGIISTVAGINGTSGATGDGGLATNATFNYPFDITYEASL